MCKKRGKKILEKCKLLWEVLDPLLFQCGCQSILGPDTEPPMHPSQCDC